MAVRRLVQLLLIAVLAVGVTSMHTLGHAHDGHGGPQATAGHLVSTASPAVPLLDILGEPAVAVRLPAQESPLSPTDPMGICLAVLTAMGFAAALTALVILGRGGGAVPAVIDPARTSHDPGRARHVPPLARRLATLSVLRT